MTTGTDTTAGLTTGFRLVKPADRTLAASQTAGMIREEAIQSGDIWAGLARTAAGNISGWHHHGAWNTVAYVIAGAVRLDYGRDGQTALQAEVGDYLFIPGGEIHRESNPTRVEQVLVIVRTGHGPVVINVDAPISVD